MEAAVAKQPGFWDVEERLKEISADGDPLETLAGAVDFERFRPILERAAGKPPGPKGGRPALDVVPEFRMLVLQSFNGLSLAATEAMARDRPGWMRFCGLELRDKAPDANTLVGLPRGAGQGRRAGQAVPGAGPGDQRGRLHSPVRPDRGRLPGLRAPPARRRRRKGRDQGGANRPGDMARRARQGGRGRTRTRAGPVKFRKAKLRPDGAEQVDIAIPGVRLQVPTPASTGSTGSSGGRSPRTPPPMTARGCGRAWSMPPTPGAGRGPTRPAAPGGTRTGSRRTARRAASTAGSRGAAPWAGGPPGPNGRKSAVRAKVEHVFAHRKDRMGLAVRTIGLARARAAITMANMAAT